jgi:hypothetical protein
MEMDVPAEASRFRAPVAISDSGNLNVIDIRHETQIPQGHMKTMDDGLSLHNSFSEMEGSRRMEYQMSDGDRSERTVV